jgi:hypothetical protein
LPLQNALFRIRTAGLYGTATPIIQLWPVICYTKRRIELKNIDGSFVHAMKGSFVTSHDTVTFMAIYQAADEWDIFVYNALTESIINMNEYNGFRSEGPKWSVDGQS